MKSNLFNSETIRILKANLAAALRHPQAFKPHHCVARSIPSFRRLKNKYKGRRGFVIGNGPSLSVEDLSKLSDEITIASNKIYLAFDSTPWRPTIYTIADPLVWEKISHSIHSDIRTVFISSMLPFQSKIKQKIYMWKSIAEVGGNSDANFHHGGLEFSPDIAKGLFSGGTITYENIQIASYIGLNPIYIIGCDHFYAGEPKVAVANNPIVAGSISNHFHPDYRKKGEAVNPACIDIMNLAYTEARRFSMRSGTEIYNTTRGGNLDIFPRVAFDDLF